jgi:hypothetical protein
MGNDFFSIAVIRPVLPEMPLPHRARRAGVRGVAERTKAVQTRMDLFQARTGQVQQRAASAGLHDG